MSEADLAAFEASPYGRPGRHRPDGPPRADRRPGRRRCDAIASLGVAIRQPVLQLLGGASAPIFAYGTSALDAALPDGRVVVLDGQRHAAHHTDPDRFVAEVERFLDAPACPSGSAATSGAASQAADGHHRVMTDSPGAKPAWAPDPLPVRARRRPSRGRPTSAPIRRASKASSAPRVRSASSTARTAASSIAAILSASSSNTARTPLWRTCSGPAIGIPGRRCRGRRGRRRAGGLRDLPPDAHPWTPCAPRSRPGVLAGARPGRPPSSRPGPSRPSRRPRWPRSGACARGSSPSRPLRTSIPPAFLYQLNGRKPDPASARALDAYFIVAAEHGFNASTFTARVITSTRCDIASAVWGRSVRSRARSTAGRQPRWSASSTRSARRSARRPGSMTPSTAASGSWASATASIVPTTRALPRSATWPCRWAPSPTGSGSPCRRGRRPARARGA